MFYKLINELFKKFCSDQHVIYSKFGHSQAMICYTVIRPVIGSDLLIDVTRPKLFLFELFLLLNLGLFIYGIKFLTQILQCTSLIRMLIPLVLALSNNSRRDMSSADGGVSLVNVLATGSTRTIGIDTDVFFIDVESVGYFGHDNH